MRARGECVTEWEIMIAASNMTKVQTFIALIRMAMGRETQLPHVPTDAQWDDLFLMAQEQAMVGVCFAGLQRLMEQGICPPHNLYMQWLALVTQIHQQNELMNLWSEEICKEIGSSGIPCCILKGQAMAALYAERKGRRDVKCTMEHGKAAAHGDVAETELSLLRQPGDIDVWMLASHREVIQWGQEHGGVWFYDYHHADLMGFHDVDVELHYRPTLSRNLWRNARLQRWLRQGERLIEKGEKSFPVPTAEFALILTLNHNFWHLMYEGVGMRQMMDLYFVLRGLTPAPSPKGEGSRYLSLIRHFGLTGFARACMWVMQEVFGLERRYMVCEPDERNGRFLLCEILQAGNFGHADVRLRNVRYKNRVALMWGWMRHTWRLFRYYPADVLWTPFGVVYISLWRRWHYRFDNIKLDNRK